VKGYENEIRIFSPERMDELFAALTSILAKVGIEGVDFNLAAAGTLLMAFKHGPAGNDQERVGMS
jgi:hypothetical protein